MNKLTQTDWLGLVETPQTETLTQLLETAPLSRHQRANQMLAAPPWPLDEGDAQARLAHVITYLMEGVVNAT